MTAMEFCLTRGKEQPGWYNSLAEAMEAYASLKTAELERDLSTERDIADALIKQREELKARVKELEGIVKTYGIEVRVLIDEKKELDRKVKELEEWQVNNTVHEDGRF